MTRGVNKFADQRRQQMPPRNSLALPSDIANERAAEKAAQMPIPVETMHFPMPTATTSSAVLNTPSGIKLCSYGGFNKVEEASLRLAVGVGDLVNYTPSDYVNFATEILKAAHDKQVEVMEQARDRLKQEQEEQQTAEERDSELLPEGVTTPD